MTSFANQVVMITGAASGIGRQLAVTLAAEGARIAALDRDVQGLARLAADLPGKPFAAAVADVTDRAALAAAVAQLTDRFSAIDLMIACAGIGIATPAIGFSAADFEAVIRVNLLGVANTIDAVLPGMLSRRRGHLAAISSLASFRGLPSMAGYCASKSGLNALLDSLRVELQPLGLAVTTICPGWVRTPMTARVEASMPDILEVDDAVRRMVAALRRRRPFVAFPRSSALRIRLLSWLPAALGDWVIGGMFRQRTCKT